MERLLIVSLLLACAGPLLVELDLSRPPPRVLLSAETCEAIEPSFQDCGTPPFWTPSEEVVAAAEARFLRTARSTVDTPYAIETYGLQFYGSHFFGSPHVWVAAVCPLHWQQFMSAEEWHTGPVWGGFDGCRCVLRAWYNAQLDQLGPILSQACR